MGKIRGRRVFFSFHYQRDIWRVNQIRQSNQPWLDRNDSYWADASLWEKSQQKGDAAIKELIDEGLHNTGVTVVLIGAKTYQRKYVGYEIEQSHVRGNGLLGVYINRLKDRYGYSDTRGPNPFDNWQITRNGREVLLSEIYSTYDWVLNDGYKNLGTWVEQAAKAVGR